MFWEAVGLCSYLLIGFWYEKPEAAAAGKKAFLVNRIGDFGFACWRLFLDLDDLRHAEFSRHAAQRRVGPREDRSGDAGDAGRRRSAGHRTAKWCGAYWDVGGCWPRITWAAAPRWRSACCCLLGACGKSAQFPLHVWLPDAMEGPHPRQRADSCGHDGHRGGLYGGTRCTPLFMVSHPMQPVPVEVSNGCRRDRRA